jgi:hypothetical protein
MGGTVGRRLYFKAGGGPRLSGHAGDAHPQRNIAKRNQVAILNIGALNRAVIKVGVIYGAEILENQLIPLPAQLTLLA